MGEWIGAVKHHFDAGSHFELTVSMAMGLGALLMRLAIENSETRLANIEAILGAALKKKESGDKPRHERVWQDYLSEKYDDGIGTQSERCLAIAGV